MKAASPASPYYRLPLNTVTIDNMTRFASTLATCLTLLAAANLLAQGRNNPARSRDAVANNWRFDYEQARKEAAEAKKPMMVVLRCVP